ncbi:hypothetical protein CCR97_04335 [Rhodoplanes elegans]|uniref:Uncharacterized protein n=2 Tax=Rhodoplanes elegans TaxID=29408 RepID=A0A327JZW0_9BRAD|nr:hypothetical protein [Rhodoplanes elegans]RAI31025.1 hypothetical protein CH338_26610 [Rhodoplanes elegans]
MDGALVVGLAFVAIVVFAPFWYALAGYGVPMKVATFAVCLAVLGAAVFFWVAGLILWLVAWVLAFVANGDPERRAAAEQTAK